MMPNLNDTILNTMATGTTDEIGELNDVLLTIVREHAETMGYDANTMIHGEVERVAAAPLMATYLKASRLGARTRINRKVRAALWGYLRTRAMNPAPSDELGRSLQKRFFRG